MDRAGKRVGGVERERFGAPPASPRLATASLRHSESSTRRICATADLRYDAAGQLGGRVRPATAGKLRGRQAGGAAVWYAVGVCGAVDGQAGWLGVAKW